MACAAVAAVMFTLWRNTSSQIDTLSHAQAAVMAFWGGLTSIALTFAIFSVYWHSRGYAGLKQPGQWLLIGFAAAVFRSVVWMLLAAATRDSNALSLPYRVFIAVATSSIIPLVFNVWCAWKVADTLKWRIAFIVFAISPILSGASSVLLGWATTPTGIKNAIAASSISLSAIRLIAVGFSALGDRLSGLQRFWTHWLGVGLFILVCVASIVGSAVAWLNW